MGQTFVDRGWDDREVKVSRDELLDVLRKNRQQHIADYKEAVAGYREAALKRIDEVMDELKSKVGALKEGKHIVAVGVSFSLPAPVTHERSYDQIVRMMEMSIDKEIVLTAGQFACFVMDDWKWKEQWKMSNAAYSASK